MLAFAGLAGALSQGWDGASLLVLGGAGGCCVIALLLAPYLRKFGGYTVPDFLGERFGGSGRPAARRAGGDVVLVPGAGLGAAWD